MIKKVFAQHNYEPGFTYIVVSKRINQRFFGIKNGVKAGEAPNYLNPPAGTVVDDVVTLPERSVTYIFRCFASLKSTLFWVKSG